MLKLRDIMTTDLAHATSDMSVREAMDILSKQHISGLPVVDGNRVVGVFSSTDVISLIGEMNDAQPWVSFRRGHTDLEEVLVADVMTRDVQSLGPDCSVEIAASFMRRCRIHRILVMEDQRLIGIVTTTDLAAAVADHGVHDHSLASS